MSDKDQQSLDVLGIKPIGESVNTLVKGTIDGAAAFLSRICLPASEEFGLLLKDKVSHWRAKNLLKIAEKAEKKLKSTPDGDVKHAHPRIATLTLEQGSWIDADEVQEMWAGLLASSCTEDGKDDSNLIFINLLSQLTTLQVKILNYACEIAEKKVSGLLGFVYAEKLSVSLHDLQEITGTSDIYRLDRELDHLNALELLVEGGFPLIRDNSFEGSSLSEDKKFDPKNNIWYKVGDPNIIIPDFNPYNVVITPSPLAFNLYVRCQGSLQSPVEFFGLSK